MGDGCWDDGWGGRHFRSRSLRKLRIIIFLGCRALSRESAGPVFSNSASQGPRSQ